MPVAIASKGLKLVTSHRCPRRRPRPPQSLSAPDRCVAAFPRRYTVRNLLNHTGGLPEYYDDIDTSKGWPTNADARALLGKMAKPVFAPGSRYEYSNPGYDMLAQI